MIGAIAYVAIVMVLVVIQRCVLDNVGVDCWTLTTTIISGLAAVPIFNWLKQIGE